MEVLQLEEWLAAAAFKAPITSQHPLLRVLVLDLGEPIVAGGFVTTVESGMREVRTCTTSDLYCGVKIHCTVVMPVQH